MNEMRAAAPRLEKRIPSLDGLRALSIGLVLIGHVATTQGAPAWMDRGAISSLGNIGVRFFFVISGFLITTLLLREREQTGQVSLTGFYLRRAYRILPAMLCYVLIIWALYLAGVIDLTYRVIGRTHLDSAVPDLLHALTFTSNYLHDYNWYYNHLWSLSVEEQFYLVWPLSLLLLGAVRASLAAWLVVLVVPFIRLAMHMSDWGPEISLSREFQAVSDALAMGVLASLGYNRWMAKAWFRRLIGPGAVVLAGVCVGLGYGSALYSRPLAYIAGQSLANVGAVILVLHAVTHASGWFGRCLNTRPLMHMGALSYSLYLWQEPFLNFTSEAWVARFPVNLLLAWGAAELSYRIVEKPFLRLKDRLHPPASTMVAKA